jgi:hypothetical protein
LTILSGKVARDHVHVFISIEGIKISMVEDDQLASTPSGVAALAKGVLGQALWGRGYLAVTSGTITDDGPGVHQRSRGRADSVNFQLTMHETSAL